MGLDQLFFIAIVILPYVLLAAALLWLIRMAYISNKAARPLFLYPLLGAFIITAAFVGWGHHEISTSRSSTAAIGWIFLPFYSVGIAIVSFLVSGAVVYIFRFVLERIAYVSPRLTSVVPLIVSALILCLTAATIESRVSRHQLLVLAESETAAGSLIDQAVIDHDLQILAALAKNPHVSETDLLRIYDACKGQVGAANSREYIVLFALSRNPKTPPSVLAALSRCQESSIRAALGPNPSTPTEILPILANDSEASVRTWVTVHPMISKELLLKLADDGVKTVREYAESNLQRRGFAENPVDEAIQKMMHLGSRAASGDLTAVDEIEEQKRQLYESIDLKTDRPKGIANLKLMRAAFDVIGTEAARNSEAMKALEYAKGKPSLRSFTVDAFGLAAGEGNEQALDALLNYKSSGWLLSNTVAAMKYPAMNNQSQAIDFLIAVLENPRHRPLHHMARRGLEGAAAKGNEKAQAARAAHAEE